MICVVLRARSTAAPLSIEIRGSQPVRLLLRCHILVSESHVPILCCYMLITGHAIFFLSANLDCPPSLFFKLFMATSGFTLLIASSVKACLDNRLMTSFFCVIRSPTEIVMPAAILQQVDNERVTAVSA